MNSIDQRNVNELAWRASERFQGASAEIGFHGYAFAMLLWKFTSDVWLDLFEKYQRKYDGDSVLINRRLSRERFQIPDGCDIQSIWECRGAVDIGRRMNQVLQQIEGANLRHFRGIFSGVDFDDETKLGQLGERNSRLKRLLEDFNASGIDFRPSKVEGRVDAGEVCEHLLEEYAFSSGRGRRCAYTPRQVSSLFAKLLDPRKGDTICDPVCGTGSLLSVVGRQADKRDFALFGQEWDARIRLICRINLFLQGIESFSVELGHSIREPGFLEGEGLKKFDIVVGHLPVSTDNWGREVARCDPYSRFDRGVPPRSKGDYAFILHMIRCAENESGRVGVIVPHGVLFRGAAEGRIRRQLIQDNLLEAVIGLPARLLPDTGAPIVLLMFNLGKCHRDVLFIEASKEFAVRRHRNCLTENQVNRIVSTFRSCKIVDRFSYRATLNEIAGNGFSLDIPLYIDTNEEVEPVGVECLGKELEQLEEKLVVVRRQMFEQFQELCR